jgi:hypothetical protein
MPPRTVAVGNPSTFHALKAENDHAQGTQR